MVLQVFKYTIETNVLYFILKGEFYGTWINSITLFFLHAQGHMKKKKNVKKKGVEYHHSPGKVRKVVGGGQKKGRRGTCIAD